MINLESQGFLEPRYIEGFKKKFRLLKKSCELYDEGNVDEIGRIATEIINLCHSGSTRSILSAIKLSKKDIYIDTAGVPSDSKMTSDFMPLVVAEFGPDFSFHPIFYRGSKVRNIKLNDWWKQTVLQFFPRNLDYKKLDFKGSLSPFEERVVSNMLNHSGPLKKKELLEKLHNQEDFPCISFTRENIVLDMRNNEGSHFSESSTEIMKLFGESSSKAFVIYEDNKQMIPKRTILSATVRQIGFEMVESLSSIYKVYN